MELKIKIFAKKELVSIFFQEEIKYWPVLVKTFWGRLIIKQ